MFWKNITLYSELFTSKWAADICRSDGSGGGLSRWVMAESPKQEKGKCRSAHRSTSLEMHGSLTRTLQQRRSSQHNWIESRGEIASSEAKQGSTFYNILEAAPSLKRNVTEWVSETRQQMRYVEVFTYENVTDYLLRPERTQGRSLPWRCRREN